jgi:hypothetical protein
MAGVGGILLELRRVEAEIARDLQDLIRGGAARRGEHLFEHVEMFALTVGRQHEPRRCLGVRAEHRQLLQHKANLVVVIDQLLEDRRRLAAIGAIGS